MIIILEPAQLEVAQTFFPGDFIPILLLILGRGTDTSQDAIGGRVDRLVHGRGYQRARKQTGSMLIFK